MSEVKIYKRPSELNTAEFVIGTRSDLEKEHSVLLARVQQIRQQLGWEPLPTGRQQRKERAERQ